MTNLPKALRTDLAGSMRLWTTEILRHTQADDGTEKLYHYIGADGMSAPMIGTEESRMNVLRSVAEKDATRMNKKIEIRKYTSFEAVDLIKGSE